MHVTVYLFFGQLVGIVAVKDVGGYGRGGVGRDKGVYPERPVVGTLIGGEQVVGCRAGYFSAAAFAFRVNPYGNRAVFQKDVIGAECLFPVECETEQIGAFQTTGEGELPVFYDGRIGDEEHLVAEALQVDDA
ncbi:hypothetical protein Barb7_01637 [Bacteroidales bacterium Barb7]|nr:hypothetical protein Barb7_01637 [Bacteroidales bacterium Barb7]